MLGIQDMRWMCRNVMAREKALFPGHPIAAVAATTEAIAAKACELIEVDYEVLPWSIEIDDALKPDAPILHDFIKFEGKPSNIAGRLEVKKGDIVKGFQEAEVVVERSFTTRPVHQGYIEPHACLISVGCRQQDHDLELEPGPVHGPRDDVVPHRHHPERHPRHSRRNRRRLSAARPSSTSNRWRTLLAKKSGRPVKMVMTREEVMRATGPTSGSKSTVKIGAKKDGTIVAAPWHFLFAGRAHCRARRSAVRSVAAFRPTISRTCLSVGFDVLSNRSKVAAYRAPGAPIGAYAVECVLDELAEALKMDPLELRLKNAAKGRHQGRAWTGLSRASAMSRRWRPRSDSDHYKAPLGKLQGRGVASGFWFNAGGESSAQVNITEDGNVVVTTGPSRYRRLARRRSPTSAPRYSVSITVASRS